VKLWFYWQIWKCDRLLEGDINFEVLADAAQEESWTAAADGLKTALFL
jgi:hypothetical protein